MDRTGLCGGAKRTRGAADGFAAQAPLQTLSSFVAIPHLVPVRYGHAQGTRHLHPVQCVPPLHPSNACRLVSCSMTRQPAAELRRPGAVFASVPTL
eukprot:349682-Chlamydomonas_euryale.AAC.20